MQGSDVLATPDIVINVRLVVWMDTNRPAPFPRNVSAKQLLFAHSRVKKDKPAAASWTPWPNGFVEIVSRQRPAARLRAPSRPTTAVPLAHRPSIAPATPSSAHTSATTCCFSSPNLSQSLLLLLQLHRRFSCQSIELTHCGLALTRSRTPAFAPILSLPAQDSNQSA